MTRLIINSDDYCRTSPISRGVREAHRQGVVSSTTCMMNFPNAAEDIEMALKETPELGMGVHLVLTSGFPLSAPEDVPTLVTAENRFPGLSEFLSRLDQVNPEEAKAEWRLQIEKFVRVSGRHPTHLDSHHHSSYYTKDLFAGMLSLAQEYGCAIRQVISQGGDELGGLPDTVGETILDYAPPLIQEFNVSTTNAFYTTFYDERATKEEIINILNNLPKDGIYELMCHPGYSDAALEATSTYNRQREKELAILTDSAVKEAIRALDIELVNFGALAS
ncbi:MAG: ChbG/HpnK family deacetylase [Candidatus Promineifilaceae bacterium]